MARKTDYQFTAVPTQLFMCLDNNCRSTLFSLIQLSSYFENKSNGSFDGWFFRTNALIEEETNLSKNVLTGALDALYKAGIIDIKTQVAGRGKTQGARSYRVNFKSFLKYQTIPIEECSCNNPEYGIVTSDYKHDKTLLQPKPQLEEQLQCRKSDNNIDNTENEDIIELIDIEDIDNSIINNYNSDYSHFEERERAFNGEETDREKAGIIDCRQDNLDSHANSVQEGAEPEDTNPAIEQDFIASQVPFVYSKVRRLESDPYSFDDYTDEANDILDQYGKEVKNWVACINANCGDHKTAAARLTEIINGYDYPSRAECEKTALDLMTYAAKSEIAYARELHDRINN